MWRGRKLDENIDRYDEIDYVRNGQKSCRTKWTAERRGRTAIRRPQRVGTAAGPYGYGIVSHRIASYRRMASSLCFLEHDVFVDFPPSLLVPVRENVETRHEDVKNRPRPAVILRLRRARDRTRLRFLHTRPDSPERHTSSSDRKPNACSAVGGTFGNPFRGLKKKEKENRVTFKREVTKKMHAVRSF